MRMQTQWKVDSMAGKVISLDYSVLPFLFKIFDAPERETFDAIQTMEIAALEILNEKRD